MLELTTGAVAIMPRAGRLTLPGTLATGLEFLHILAAGVDPSLRNWADGKPNATKVGAPVAGAGFLTLRSGVDYLKTGLLDVAGDRTYLVVGRDVSGGAAGAARFAWIGSAVGQSGGANLYTLDGTSIRYNVPYSNAGGEVNSSAVLPIPKVFNCLIMTAAQVGLTSTAADNPTLYNMTTGVSAVGSLNDGYARVANGQPVIIGGFSGTAFGGVGDEALAMCWSRVLTDAERVAAYAWAKALVATKSIAV
ncbi:hypothetical protein ASF00_10555 [Sphingomonas sp. Leaf34]|nr:hypothetical protein ASF00_10555 [Sphingomonas sp. Leaf34]